MTHALDGIATLAFAAAIRERRPGELLQHLFDGGGLTFNPDDPEHPIWIPASEIIRLTEDT